MSRQKLNLNLDELFPGDTLKIGNQTVHIKPLGIEQLSIISKKLKGFTAILAEEDITLDNYNEPANLVVLSSLLLEQFPEVLEEASNIELSDLKQLPLDIILEVVSKVIDVNLASRDSLTKNFNNLIGKINLQETQKKQKSSKRSKK